MIYPFPKQRWCFVLFALFILGIGSGRSFAQQQTIRFTESKLPVSRIISIIEQQSRHMFAYDASEFNTRRNVRLRKSEYTLDEIVDLIVRSRKFSYRIQTPYIIITTLSLEEEEPEPEPVPEPVIEYHPAIPATQTGQLSSGSPDFVPEPFYVNVNRNLPKITHKLAIQSNLLYTAVAVAPNLAVEHKLGKKGTLEWSASYCRWLNVAALNKNKKLDHRIVRVEYRHWLKERFQGHFLGAHVFAGDYTVRNYNLLWLFDRQYRYEGNGIGAGITYGYSLPLGKRWNIIFHAGAGFIRMDYDKYSCGLACDEQAVAETKTYWGPTRAGITLSFAIK